MPDTSKHCLIMVEHIKFYKNEFCRMMPLMDDMYFTFRDLRTVYNICMTVLNSIILIISRSHLSITQLSSSFKRLDMRTFTYTIPTLITEVLHFVTRVQLLLTTVTVN